MLDDAREETVSQTGDSEPDTKDAEALASALNHSAERVQTLWFSFLTFMLYLAIATGTTTHRMLFLEEPLNLPVLNIKLPLLGFYVLTPGIFVVFHFYMLLNLVLLARTAKSFEDALLQGVSLNSVQLQGASIEFAQLQAAALHGAQLQGALLDGALLQGASLNSVQLQGASLFRAQLQGALLESAQLQGASFVDVCVWRADARQAAWQDTRVVRRETDPKEAIVHECVDSFAALKRLITVEVSEGVEKFAAMARIERRLNPAKALEGEKEMAEIWAAREGMSPTPEAYAKTLAGQWRKLGCVAEGAPYVLQGLVRQLSDTWSSPFRDQSAEAKALAADFLYKDCAGAHGLSEADKAKLKKIAAPAAQKAPKP